MQSMGARCATALTLNTSPSGLTSSQWQQQQKQGKPKRKVVPLTPQQPPAIAHSSDMGKRNVSKGGLPWDKGTQLTALGHKH